MKGFVKLNIDELEIITGGNKNGNNGNHNGVGNGEGHGQGCGGGRDHKVEDPAPLPLYGVPVLKYGIPPVVKYGIPINDED